MNVQGGNRIQNIYGRKQQGYLTNQVQGVNSLSSNNYHTANNTKIPTKKKPAGTIDKLKDLGKRLAEKPFENPATHEQKQQYEREISEVK